MNNVKHYFRSSSTPGLLLSWFLWRIMVVIVAIATVASAITCIANETQLRQAISQAPQRVDTNVTLCYGKRIVISSMWMAQIRMSGIDVSNKYIHVMCSSGGRSVIGTNATNQQNPPRCQLDGGLQSRIFYGASCRLYLYYVDVLNSFPFSSSGISEDQYGGAIYLKQQSILGIVSSSFYSNNVQYYGGAIYLEKSICTLTNNVTFRDNLSFLAGAIYAYQSSIVATNGVYFESNIASTKYGAMLTNQSNISFSQVYFYKNQAKLYNGAVAFYNSTVQMDDVTFMNHTSSKTSGTVDLWYSNATLNRVVFFGNSAVGFGASLYVLNSKVRMTNTVHGYNKVPAKRFGTDLYIADPSKIVTSASSYVDCYSNNTFCSETNKTSIYDRNGDDNTNCRMNGINGTNGKGLCTFPNTVWL